MWLEKLDLIICFQHLISGPFVKQRDSEIGGTGLGKSFVRFKSRLEVFQTVYSQIRAVAHTQRSPSGHRGTSAPRVLETVRTQLEPQQRSSGPLRQVARDGVPAQRKYTGAQAPRLQKPRRGAEPTQLPLPKLRERNWDVADTELDVPAARGRREPSHACSTVCLPPPPRPASFARSPPPLPASCAWPLRARGRRPACVRAPDFISG